MSELRLLRVLLPSFSGAVYEVLIGRSRKEEGEKREGNIKKVSGHSFESGMAPHRISPSSGFINDKLDPIKVPFVGDYYGEGERERGIPHIILIIIDSHPRPLWAIRRSLQLGRLIIKLHSLWHN